MLLNVKLIPINTRNTGFAKETKALKFLRKNGYRCIARNYTSRYGEIDLIVLRELEVLAFVEVRYRKNLGFGSPAETVSITKQSRIKRTASYFLCQYKEFSTMPCRFDVVSISLERDSKHENLEWIKNAFY